MRKRRVGSIGRGIARYKKNDLRKLARHTSNERKKSIKQAEDGIRDLKEKISEIQIKWKSEKENIDFISKVKKELETLKLEADASERKSDFAKVAELRYGKTPELERQLKLK